MASTAGDSKADEGVWLVFGGSGWIGGQLIEMLKARGKNAVAAKSRLENRDDVAKELDELKPVRVLNAAGLTGRPNVDQLEIRKEETLRVNVIGTLSLLDLCNQRGIHVTNYATGCIYSYDDAHPLGSGKGFTEEDEPNFTGSFYSFTKGLVEKLQRPYNNVMVLRVRMPVADDLHPRNFITKICKYRYVVNIPNSMTLLTEMLPLSLTMAERELTGVYNFTNPGTLSHNQILDLYKKHIDPGFWYENFSEEDQAKVLKAGRSNNELDTTKLQAAVPDIKITPAQEAIVGVFERMAAGMKAAGEFPPPPFKAATPEEEDAAIAARKAAAAAAEEKKD